MRLKSLGPILACLLTVTAILPVQAAVYTVTMTLTYEEEILWTFMIEFEIPDDSINLKVPEQLYDLIVWIFGTDTFMVFLNVTLGPFNLLVESDPSELTLVLEPMSPGDVDDDGIVTVLDILKVGMYFGDYDLFCDVDFNFEINISDLLTVIVSFGETY